MLLALCALLAYTTAVGQNKTLTFSDSAFVYKVAMDSTSSKGFSDCNVKSITVSNKSDNAVVQTINPDDNIVSCDWVNKDFFVVEDMNFDGKNDFRMLLSQSPGGNMSYAYWLYNPTTRAFERNGAYEDSLATVTFDREKKLVKSYWSSGIQFGTETYKVVKGKLQLIEREMITPEESATGYYTHEVYKLTGGAMKRTAKDRLTEDEVQKLQQP